MQLFSEYQMFVISNYKFCICGNCTIHKFVIINIFCNQTKMIIGILKIGCTQSGYSLHYTMSDFFSSLLRKNFFIFIENLRINTQLDFTIQHI